MVRLARRRPGAARRRRLPLRRRHRDLGLPGRSARQAAARRGPGRGGQDPARQGRGGGDRRPAVRLQCYEGLDEARALYEWNYKKQLLRIQAGSDRDWDATHDDIFTEEFLLERPLLQAIRAETPTVLLIDETDKADVEVEGLLLEILSDYQVTIPELGTITAVRKPYVVLTSNATRELSEALKRRCLYLHLDYPTPERERDIVLAQVPTIEAGLAEQLARTVATLRALELKKAPSIAETDRLGPHPARPGPDELDEATIGAHPRRGAQARLRPDPGAQGARACARPRGRPGAGT